MYGCPLLYSHLRGNAAALLGVRFFFPFLTPRVVARVAASRGCVGSSIVSRVNNSRHIARVHIYICKSVALSSGYCSLPEGVLGVNVTGLNGPFGSRFALRINSPQCLATVQYNHLASTCARARCNLVQVCF